MGIFAATAVTFVTLLFAVGADRADRHQTNHLLFQAIRAHSNQPQIACYKILEPSWVFYGGLPIHEFGGSSKEANQLAIQQLVQFLHSSPDAFVITTASRLKELPRLTSNEVVIAEAPYFLKDDKLVVLGCPTFRASMTTMQPARLTLPNDLR